MLPVFSWLIVCEWSIENNRERLRKPWVFVSVRSRDDVTASKARANREVRWFQSSLAFGCPFTLASKSRLPNRCVDLVSETPRVMLCTCGEIDNPKTSLDAVEELFVFDTPDLTCLDPRLNCEGTRYHIILIIFLHFQTHASIIPGTVDPDLIATEMLGFPSKSSRNRHDSDPINEKTTPIMVIMSMISIANFNDSNHFSSLFSPPLDCRYQI